VVEAMDLVMIDVKHADTAVHRRFTGVGNERILANLDILRAGTTAYIVRIPLIPGVNDDEANLAQIAGRIAGAPALMRVELLPYNSLAPAKYAAAGRDFAPGFDASRPVHIPTHVFAEHMIPCEVL
jgi:pyruvate formate lyase activating enzyme